VRLAEEALAVEPDEPERTVRLRLHLGGYLAEAGSHDRALVTLVDVAEAAPPGTILRVRCGTALARELIAHGRFEDAAREARTQAEQAHGLRARTEEATARAVEASALARLGRLGDALAALERAPAAAIERVSSRSRTHSRPSRFAPAMQSYLDRAGVHEQAGDASAAARVALEGRDEAARRGLSDTLGVVMAAVAAHELLQSGAWDEAADLLASVEPASGTHHEPGTGMAALVRARLASLRGQWDAAADALDVARAGSVAVGQPGWAALADLAVAETATWRGHYRDARTAVVRGIALAESDGDRTGMARLACIGIRVEADAAAAALRRTRRDAVPSDEIATGHWVRLQAGRAVDDGGRSSPRWTALVLTGAAELARAGSDLGSGAVPDAPAPWDAVVAAWETAGDPYAAAYARFRRAEASLARAGDRVTAASDLREALSVADRLAAVPLGREVEELARRARLAGVRDDRASARSGDRGYVEARRQGLSDREIDVLALLAAGLSDREIAERLFISTKTTGHHVSHILAKLGVERRGEAAAVAFGIGLLTPADPGARHDATSGLG
jgi:DNA-binding CsgD family transcriptional regulator